MYFPSHFMMSFLDVFPIPNFEFLESRSHGLPFILEFPELGTVFHPEKVPNDDY